MRSYKSSACWEKKQQSNSKSIEDNTKMFLNYKEIIFFASFISFVYAKDESQDMRKIKENMAKTSIITYKKAITSEENVLSFLNELKIDSGLKVKHLPNIGAFLITYQEMERMENEKTNLMRIVDNYKMTYDENRFFTYPEDPILRDVDIQVPDEPEEEIPNDRDHIEILVPDEPKEEIPNDRTLDQSIPPNDKLFYGTTSTYDLNVENIY